MEQLIHQVEKYFDILGPYVATLFGIILIIWQLRKRSAKVDVWFDKIYIKLHLKPGIWSKRIIIILASILAIGAYLFCLYCGKSMTEKANHDANFLHILVSFSVRVFPYFIAGCVLSGIIEKIFRKNSRWLPTSMIGAGIFASIMPICSCAAVPFSYSLMATRKIRLRGVITFMMVVPVLNPFVITFAQGVLGWQYVAYRIGSIFLLAMVTGTLIERFLGEREPDNPIGACFSCKGCGKSSNGFENADSAFEAAYGLIKYLIPYMIIGIAIGAAFTVYIPTFVVGKYLSAKFTGMVLAVLIGLPVFLCSGEDVLILAPLMEMGLPMGHGIALTIAGNGICLSSIALLFPLFGKKATFFIVASFLIGSILIGLGINLVTTQIHF